MKILLSLFFVILSVASYATTLHPQDDCESYKSNLVSQVDSFSSIGSDIDDAIEWDSTASRNLQRLLDKDPEGTNIWVRFWVVPAMDQISSSTNSLNTYKVNFSNSFDSFSNLVNSLDCTSCPVSSSSNCCDFTEIITHIDSVKTEVIANGLVVSQVKNYLSTYLPSIITNLQYVNFLLEHGFSDVTNQIATIGDNLTNVFSVVNDTLDSGLDVITNLLVYGNGLVSDGFYNTTNLLSKISDSSFYLSTNFLYLVNPLYRRTWEAEVFPQVQYVQFPFYSGYGSSAEMLQSPFLYTIAWNFPQFTGLLPSLYLQGLEDIGIGYAQLNWEQYKNETVYPPITNALYAIYKSNTNFFSFFRGEVGVNGVLSDWTPQHGNYYDFLTNHYLSVVRGDTLSASLSTKTNWFSRIETLLSALVFADASSTNTVSTSSGQQEQSDLSSSLSSLNSNASQVSSDFSTSSTSIITLYQLWAANFDTAALPSHVVMFTLSNTDENDSVSFNLSDHPGLVAFVEGCRAITTFCWASVGIFLLYRFMVWCARCVYVACRFLYSVISAIFK